MQSSTLQWSQFCHISHRTGSASNAESSVLQYHRAGSALNADSFTLQRSQFCDISPHRANRASNAERFTLQRSQFCAISPHRAGKAACQSFTLRSQFFVSEVCFAIFPLRADSASNAENFTLQQSQLCMYIVSAVSVLRYFPIRQVARQMQKILHCRALSFAIFPPIGQVGRVDLAHRLIA